MDSALLNNKSYIYLQTEHKDVKRIECQYFIVTNTGNIKLEEAIQYYEAALVEMQRENSDYSQRMFVRSMLLRAYEIQAITSPEVRNDKLFS